MELIGIGEVIQNSSRIWHDVNGERVHGIYYRVLKRTEHTIVFLHGRIMGIYIYPRIQRSFQSRLLNDFNLNFVGGWAWPDENTREDEMVVNRVAKGLKPAGFNVGSRERCEMLEEIARNAGLVTRLHKNPHVSEYFELGVARKGTFGDTFNLEAVESDYDAWGIHEDIVKELSRVEFSDLLVDFDYANVESNLEWIETGLLLGYPMETTASILGACHNATICVVEDRIDTFDNDVTKKMNRKNIF